MGGLAQCLCHRQPFASRADMGDSVSAWLDGPPRERERERANNAHLGAPWRFLMLVQYDAPASHSWDMGEIKRKEGDIHKDIV